MHANVALLESPPPSTHTPWSMHSSIVVVDWSPGSKNEQSHLLNKWQSSLGVSDAHLIGQGTPADGVRTHTHVHQNYSKLPLSSHVLPLPLPSPSPSPSQTYINVPNGSTVVEEGVELPNVADVPEVPRVQAVVVVHTGQLQQE